MTIEFEGLIKQAIQAFEKQFNIEARHFGNKHAVIKGASDDARGVQWNIAVLRDTNEIRLGVNLEGMTYQGWPITTFIQNELKQPSIIEMLVTMREPEQAIITFKRDAWQKAGRHQIEEHQLANSETNLNSLTLPQWREMLSEALTCLDKSRDYRGRGLQMVTKRTGKKEMEVSPHFNIHSYLHYKENNIETALAQTYQNLKPVYEWLKSKSR